MKRLLRHNYGTEKNSTYCFTEQCIQSICPHAPL